jgi:hypothetical protein
MLDIVHVARPLSRSLLAWPRGESEVAAQVDGVVASACRHGAAGDDNIGAFNHGFCLQPPPSA